MPAMSPLLRELLEHLADDMLPSAARLRAEAVVFDLLDPVQVIPIGVRMPSDGRARAIATALVANPADQRTLPELAAQAGASARTIARLFHRETAMTFGRWRTQVRLRAGLPLLAQGVALSGIAARVGYSTPSAFVAAFHREGGVSPRRYFSG